MELLVGDSLQVHADIRRRDARFERARGVVTPVTAEALGPGGMFNHFWEA